MATMWTIHLDGDGCWEDLAERDTIHLANDSPPVEIALLKGGMKSGRASIALRIDIDQKSIIVETSARMFLQVADMIRAGLEAE